MLHGDGYGNGNGDRNGYLETPKKWQSPVPDSNMQTAAMSPPQVTYPPQTDENVELGALSEATNILETKPLDESISPVIANI
ncbi:hypothetical protein Tco_1273799 [Tanacetum coccineum]